MRALIIPIVLRLHDLYCDLCVKFRKFYLYLVAMLCTLWWDNRSSTYLVYAALLGGRNQDELCDRDDIDVTPFITAYYATDRILSCASMERWISRWYNSCEYGSVLLVFIDGGKLKASRLNLSDDKELFTDVDTCDATLSKLPHRVLCAPERV